MDDTFEMFSNENEYDVFLHKLNSLYPSVRFIFETKIKPEVGRAVTRSSLEWDVGGSNLRPVKSNTVLPTTRHRCDISSKEAVLPG